MTRRFVAFSAFRAVLSPDCSNAWSSPSHRFAHRGTGEEVELRPRSDTRGERTVSITSFDLRRWHQEGWESRRALSTIYENLTGATTPSNGSDSDHVLAAIERSVERGDVVAVVPARTRPLTPPCAGAQEDQAAPQPSDKPKSIVKKTWISIQLIDEQKKPLAGAAFEIGNGDAVIKSGTLDEHGSAYLDGIPDGKYEAAFPSSTDASGAERALELSRTRNGFVGLTHVTAHRAITT